MINFKVFLLSIYKTRTATGVCCLTTELTEVQMKLSSFKLSKT